MEQPSDKELKDFVHRMEEKHNQRIGKFTKYANKRGVQLSLFRK